MPDNAVRTPIIRTRRPAIFVVTLISAANWSAPGRADCSLTSTGRVPLNDLGAGQYNGFPGGLYPNGSSIRPPELEAAAAAQAAEIRPLDTDGNNDDNNGRIVFISVGISNTSQEFMSGGPGSFMARMQSDASKNPQVDLINCALGGHAAVDWANPADPAWDNLRQRIANAGRDPLQVQVAWLKHSERIGDMPDQSFPAHAQWLQEHLEIILRLLREELPNLKIVFFSSRTRSYSTSTGASPEPWAYEGGFAVKWLIEKQMSGDAGLNYNKDNGPVMAPMALWGPYLWADGLTPRSDEFIWSCSDLTCDFNHPSDTGVTKVADQIIAFFKTDPLTRSWFLRTSVVGHAPTVKISADRLNGPAPLLVNFDALAGDADGSIVEYAWNFGEGGYSMSASPAMTFTSPGVYPVFLTVMDNDSNPVTASVFIQVTGIDVPAISSWGMGIMALFVLCAGSVIGWGRVRSQSVMVAE